MNKGLLFLAAVALPLLAAAQQSASPDDAEKIRRYTIEIIIFEYAENVSVGNEIFVPELLNPQVTTQEQPDEDTTEESDADERIYQFEYSALPRSELTMNETWGRLQRLDAYRPLMHFGWTQTTIPENQTPEFDLSRFGRPPSGLDGTLKLYLSRFLHLDIDLSMPADATNVASPQTAPVVAFSDQRTRSETGESYVPEYGPARYRIVEDRIMKNGETRYFDHPKFGVIAKVIRVED
ncbi:MAG: peptidoglycan binding protein CsiV [Gammaproteobacteria bacterium]|nr:peptidoglycan binding protein CsiV [Gammaproteobacteria bacterium]NNC77875.1 hypothetical protein [Woeseiaceae bacterium]